MKPALKTGLRRSPLDAVLVLLSTAAFSLAAVSPGTRIWVLALLFLFLALAALGRAGQAFHVTLFSCLAVAAPAVLSLAKYWPWSLLISLSAYGMMVLCVPGLRRGAAWFRRGSLGKAVWLWMLVTIVGSAAALVGWYVWLKPDLSLYFAQMPAMSVYLLPLAGLGFALLNAVMEEVAFRGILMSGLDSASGRPGLSLGVQAMAFGLFHYRYGFPNGVSGFLMTFVYGLLLGWIKYRSKGLLAPVITHVFADLTIFAILAAILSG